MASPVEATRENFRDLVAHGIALVDVWGPQCRPCLALRPHVERFASELELSLVMLEAPRARRLCIELQVMGMPTFLLFRDGLEVARLTGPELAPAEVQGWLESTLRELGTSSA